MKRVLVSLLFILIGIYLTLSFFDSSDYMLEKKFWYLKKDFISLANDPKSSPEQEFKALARRYDELITENPDTALGGQIILQKGLVYSLMKDYQSARAAFEKILKLYTDDEALNAETLFQIGKTYEAEGNVPQAVKMYQTAQEKYPTTLTGIKMPLYTANYYERENKGAQAQQAYAKAVDFYQHIYEQYPQSRIGYMALGFQATSYLTQENWEQSLDVLERLLLDFPRMHKASDPQGPVLIKTINQVAIERLQDTDRAVRIYKKFIDQYPQHPFKLGLDKLIDKLKSLGAKEQESAS